MASEGAAIMCADIDEQGAQGTAAMIAEHGGRSAAMKLDVASEDAVKAALETTAKELGGLNVIFNNAGVGGGHTWDQTIAVNLSGVYHGLFHGAPFLAERGGGSIINTASVAGLVGLVGAQPPAELQPGAGAYVAAKHGVSGLTRQFAITFGPRGVRVNAIAPGYIYTPMTAQIREVEGAERFLASLHPIGRLGQPEEIAAAAAFLASDDASFITGVVLPVDGGYTAR
jgi:NAD(P)-dependent dehydrogenase (short-subunit alcohol dehydrogenase family)